MNTQTSSQTSFSIPSIIALVAAILSFVTGPGLGFILAIGAIIFGLIGVMLSLSPRVRGGFTSTIGIVAGVLGIIVALIKTAGWLLS
jgi:hypothetical protein